jgi:hypothetical protein
LTWWIFKVESGYAERIHVLPLATLADGDATRLFGEGA